jgi:hypothetical protein
MPFGFSGAPANCFMKVSLKKYNTERPIRGADLRRPVSQKFQKPFLHFQTLGYIL